MTRNMLSTAMLLLYAATSAVAQDSDAVVLKDSRQNFTILSQIEDPQERRAFMGVYNEKNPERRHALAESFMKAYPQSWLLSQVYDLAATSSIDLGNSRLALQEGRFSLRLSPENATLLVLMANVEAQNKMYDQAETSARDALEYLDEFARPGNVTDRQWSRTKPKLKAAAYFALGRVYAARGFATEGSARANLLRRAEQFLDYAAAWNRSDPEIFYLRGLTEVVLQEPAKAVTDLKFVSRKSQVLREKALDNLQTIHERGSDAERSSKPAVNEHLRDERPQSDSSEAIRGGYAGPSACQTCHAHEYQTWRQTGMARMFRAYSPENVIGDFSPGSEFKDDSGAAVIRMGIDSRPYFDIRQSGGGWHRFHVDYTIGSKWQQGYATKAQDGSFHVLPIEYNVLRKAWINYWKMIDPPGSERAKIADFSKLLATTNYQENCAICHTSQLRAVEDKTPMEHATFLQPGVDCEMCHGPSARHVKQMHAGLSGEKPANEPPVDFRKIGNREGIRICAQCHRQAAVREIGEQNELNYSAEGDSFVPKAWIRPYDAFSRRAFYKDGRFRETTFIVEAFTRSCCYRKGTAQCASCHAPHLDNFSQNLTALKFKSNPDEMCLRCHTQYRSRIAEHTHHAQGSEASQCVSCHMPRIVNALLFKARSHQIEIPTADLTLRFGQNESPNACLMCHSDQGAQWAEQQLKKWQG